MNDSIKNQNRVWAQPTLHSSLFTLRSSLPEPAQRAQAYIMPSKNSMGLDFAESCTYAFFQERV